MNPEDSYGFSSSGNITDSSTIRNRKMRLTLV